MRALLSVGSRGKHMNPARTPGTLQPPAAMVPASADEPPGPEEMQAEELWASTTAVRTPSRLPAVYFRVLLGGYFPAANDEAEICMWFVGLRPCWAVAFRTSDVCLQ